MSNATRSTVRAAWRLANCALSALDIVAAPFSRGLLHRRAGSSAVSAADKWILDRSWRQCVLYAGVLSIFCLVSPPSLANGVLHGDLGGANFGDGTRLAGLDAACIALAFTASLLFLAIARRLGPLREGVGLGYVGCGIALLGMTRMFYVVADTGVITIHRETLDIWSHAIYCLAMVVSICGGKVLSKSKNADRRLASPGAFARWCVIAVLATVAVFSTAELLDDPFVAVFQNSFFDSFPVEHLIAFVVSAIALAYMIESVDVDESLSGVSKNAVLIFPLMLGYFLFSLEHLWELLLEILHVTAVRSTTMAERVEQMIVLLAFLVVTYAGARLWFATRKPGGHPMR